MCVFPPMYKKLTNFTPVSTDRGNARDILKLTWQVVESLGLRKFDDNCQVGLMLIGIFRMRIPIRFPYFRTHARFPCITQDNNPQHASNDIIKSTLCERWRWIIMVNNFTSHGSQLSWKPFYGVEVTLPSTDSFYRILTVTNYDVVFSPAIVLFSSNGLQSSLASPVPTSNYDNQQWNTHFPCCREISLDSKRYHCYVASIRRRPCPYIKCAKMHTTCYQPSTFRSLLRFSVYTYGWLELRGSTSEANGFVTLSLCTAIPTIR